MLPGGRIADGQNQSSLSRLPARKVLANMAGTWPVAQQVQRAADIFHDPARDRWAGLLNEEALDMV